MKLSVIIPAYNEEQVIIATTTEVASYSHSLFGVEAEILVVDDGSTDTTVQKVLSLPGVRLIQHQTNQGKGAAVRTGALAASGDYVLFMDADNSTKINELPAFLTAAESGADVVIASRALASSAIIVSQNWVKQLLGKLGNTIIQVAAVPGIHDTQCGFKLFRRSSTRVLFEQQSINRWAFDIELLAMARWRGLKIVELPVRWENNFNSKVKPVDYFTTLMAVFGVQLNKLLGKYKL